jgi:lipopolysaccharide/colanic/teichoic acid biosynthesis glycosyltransferase
MKPLLPKSEEKKTHIQKKAKSAKYKGIERISRRVFYLVVLLIFSLFIAVLTLAILKQDEEIIEESSITVGDI